VHDQRRTPVDRGDEQVPGIHLEDALGELAVAEEPGGSAGETVEACRGGRDLVAEILRDAG
jgi:hypothetical protein